MHFLGTFYMAAIPADARGPETSYPLNQCGKSYWVSGEKEKTVSDQRLSMNWIRNKCLCSAIASSSAEEPKTKEPKAKKQKIDKKHSDSRSILVRAFARRGDDFHFAEVEITLDSDGAFAVDYVAAKLLLKGTLYVGDIIWQAARFSLNLDYPPKESLLV